MKNSQRFTLFFKSMLMTLALLPAALFAASSNNPTVSLSPTTYSVNEGSGTVTVTFTVSIDVAPNKRKIKLAYTTTDGTAISGTNYVTKSGTLNFAKNGSTASKTVSVTVYSDVSIASDISFNFTLSNNGTNAAQNFSISPSSATVTIEVGGAGNTAPVADAGTDQSVNTNASVTLDGSGSYDPDGDPLSYAWSFSSKPAGSTATLTGANTVSPTFTADVAGSYTFSLIVNDGTEDSPSDSVTIIVTDPEPPPIENADDLCYDTITYDGLFCLDFGAFKGGIGCTQTIPIRNQGTGQLTDVNVTLDMTGISGNMFSECGIDGSAGNCADETDINMGPIGIFGRGVVYEPMPDYDANDSHSIYTTSLMSAAMFSGTNLYGTYLKDGSRYVGAISACSEDDTVNDSPIPTGDSDPITAICGTFEDVLQTRSDPSDIHQKSGATASIENPDCDLNTGDVDFGTYQELTCNTNDVAVETGTYSTSLSLNYDYPPTLDTVSTTPATSGGSVTYDGGQTLDASNYNSVQQNYQTGLTFNFTNISNINTLKVNTNNTVTFTNANSYNLDIGTIGKTYNGSGNSFSTINTPKNIKINTFDLAGGTTINFEAEQTIKINTIKIGRDSSDVTLKAPYVQLGSLTQSNSGSGTSNLTIYADYVDIDTLDLDQEATITIKPYTTGQRILFKANSITASSSSTMIVDSGNYYTKSFDIPGSSNISSIRASDSSQLINFFIDGSFSPGNNPGINSNGNNGDFGSLPPSNFLFLVNGDLNTGGGGTTFNATVYVEGSTDFGSPSYLNGALSSNGDIEIGNGSRFTYAQDINGDWGPCSTPTFPPYQNEYACDVFGSVLTTYDYLTVSGNNEQVCGSGSISYPDGSISGTIDCHADAACGGTAVNCDRVDPPSNRYSHDFPTNSLSGASHGSNPTTLTDIEYGDLTYSNTDVDLSPSNTYSDKSTKVMLLGDVVISKTTLNFEPGDYYFDSLTINSNNNDVVLPSGGVVRLFIKGDLGVAMNNLHFNSTGSASNLFVYVNGNFVSIGNGGGTTNWKAFMYVEGDVTLNNNSNNWEIYGGITAEGSITVTGNNPDFIASGDAGNFGLGECSLCFERPSGVTNTVETAITNEGGIELTDLNISKAYSYTGFSNNGSSITSDNAGATANYDSAILVEIDGLANFSNPTTASGYTYEIGDYLANQQDTLSDTTDITFVLDDYNTSNPDTLKALFLAEYMDGDRYYNVMVQRCSEWGYSTYLTGPYDAWDTFRGDTVGNDGIIDDMNISTKIQNEPFSLTIASLDETHTMLETKSVDSNVTFGLYDASGLISTESAIDVSVNDSITANYTIDKSSKEVYVGFKFCASYDGSLYTLADDSACTGTVYNCSITTTNPEWHLCPSSDSFAIRPQSFSVAQPAGQDIELLRSGVDYNFTVSALDYNNAVATDYNQSTNDISVSETLWLSDNTEDTGSTLNGTLQHTATNVNFASGVSNSVDLSFSDVAKVTIAVEDQQWSIVDQDDTPQSCDSGTVNGLNIPYGAYICGDINATFIPDHFDVTSIHLRNHRDGDFTYLSNDLNMSAHLDVSISAMNANNAITQNFNKSPYAYENPVSVDLNVTEWNNSLPNRHPQGNAVITKDISNATTLGFGGTDANGTHSIAWNDSNESQKLMFNYERQISQTVNPFEINGTDIKITVTSLYTSSSSNQANITGSGTGDRNATFVYGGALPNLFFYDNITTNSTNTPVSLVAYCDLGLVNCQNNGLTVIANGLLEDARSHEAQWWTVERHDSSLEDGDVTLTSSNGTVNPSNPNAISPTNGIDESITVTNSSGTVPNIVDIDFGTDTNTWLIYNKDGNAIPSPFYRVRFIGTSGWTGHGKTGHVVGDDINTKKSKRLEW